MNDREKLHKLLDEHDDIRAHLFELFVTEQAVLKWFTSPRVQLGKKSPAQCIEGEPDSVKDLLDRISHGDFS